MDTALRIIAKVGIVYNKLERRNQKKLLHEMVNRVVVSPEGSIKRMELLPPFAYLKEVVDRVQNGSVGFEGKPKTSPWAGQCLSLVSPGTPNRYSTIIRTPEQAVSVLINHVYSEGTIAERLEQRNEEIRRLFAERLTKAEIARQFDISERRVGQVVEDE